MTPAPLEAIRVVVVEPGWTSWFLLGAVSGLALAVASALVFFWRGRNR